MTESRFTMMNEIKNFEWTSILDLTGKGINQFNAVGKDMNCTQLMRNAELDWNVDLKPVQFNNANDDVVTLEESCSTTGIEKEFPLKTCKKCDYIAQTLQEMRRHESDTHGIITGSTSPPTKRKRNQCKITTDNIEMDVESDANVSKLDLQIEDMEIDLVNEPEDDFCK